MDVNSLADLLQSERFGECREAAEAMLRRDHLEPREKAQIFLVLSRSLAALQTSQEALGPGELAVHFCRESKDYDLLGRALCHLAALYHENRLHKRAAVCLDEYFQYVTLYDRARALEGWVLHHLAACYQAMARGPRALEYFEKACRWYERHGAEPQQLNLCRAELVWQSLRLGQLDHVSELMVETDTYLAAAPNDVDARARHWSNLAYRAYVTGDYGAATDLAIRVLQIRGISALRKSHAYLILHYTSKATGLHQEAMGTGVLVRIHAAVARRPDLEEEATRSMLQMYHRESLPLMDQLFQKLTGGVRQARKASC